MNGAAPSFASMERVTGTQKWAMQSLKKQSLRINLAFIPNHFTKGIPTHPPPPPPNFCKWHVYHGITLQC